MYRNAVGILLAAGMAAIIALATMVADQAEMDSHRRAQRSSVLLEVSGRRALLEANVSSHLNLAHALSAFARSFPSFSNAEFHVFAEGLRAEHPGIRSLQLAPGAVITHVHPLLGNEQALGHNLLADPERAPGTRKAIESRQMVLVGPVTLLQGGVGIIARQPVFLTENGKEKFWGLAIVVLDVLPLLRQSGITQGADGLVFGVKGTTGDSTVANIFMGTKTAFDSDAVETDVVLPGGIWHLAAAPTGGWVQSWPYRWILLGTGAFAALTAGTLIWRLWSLSQSLRRLAEDSRAKERRLAAIFDQTFQLLGTLDRNGRITAINQSALAMIGLDLADVTDTLFWDSPWWRHSPEEANRVRIAVAKAREGHISRFDTTNINKDGRTIHVDVSIKPVLAEDGSVLEILAEGRDITEIKEAQEGLREREELYHHMFMSNTAIKLLIDPADGRIVDANHAAEAFYGYPRPVLLSMTIYAINRLPMEQIQKTMEAARTEDHRYFRFEHRLASGEIRNVEVYSGPVRVKGHELLHSIIHDVTERDRLQEQLLSSNAELEQFAYVASHDLREPLRMVSSFLGLLDRRLQGRLNDEEREYIEFAINGARRMDNLVRALLELSRVGRREGSIIPMPLDAALNAALAFLHPSIKDSGAIITVTSSLPQVRGDEDELSRVLVNLIGNAIKYRKPDTQPLIRIESRILSGQCEITVSDNGIGIEPAYFERIFMIFQRLHGRDSSYEGTGIGLALAKKIIEYHGGTIRVESRLGEGSRFIFTLNTIDEPNKPS
ncbi:putative Histidine kinase [Candidatus Terasakiella magnetica]|nr:putative Histidine kinase [Candidatus Terasakiella magnetica]